MSQVQMSSASILTNEQLLRKAPSVFAEAPSSKVSDRYGFIPTIQVVDVLRSQGWEPVKAMQSRGRSEEGRNAAKHLIRFRNTQTNLQVGDSFAELILVNSHNGASAFQLLGGIFRLVCSNGMIVGDTYAAQSVRHTGYTNDKVIEAQYRVLETVPQIAGSVQRMSSVELKHEEQMALAESALQVRYSETNEEGELVVKAPIIAEQLLLKRRTDDRKNDLWTVFNGIQENILRGGLRGVSESMTETGRIQRRRTRTREVQSVTENVRLNRALWSLAEKMAELKGA